MNTQITDTELVKKKKIYLKMNIRTRLNTKNQKNLYG